MIWRVSVSVHKEPIIQIVYFYFFDKKLFEPKEEMSDLMRYSSFLCVLFFPLATYNCNTKYEQTSALSLKHFLLIDVLKCSLWRSVRSNLLKLKPDLQPLPTLKQNAQLWVRDLCKMSEIPIK